MEKLENLADLEQVQKRRVQKLSNAKEGGFIKKLRFSFVHSTALFFAMMVNSVIDFFPLYSTFSLVTNDNLVMLLLLTFGFTIFFAIASYAFGDVLGQKLTSRAFIITATIVAFLPQICILALRFTMKNELFPLTSGGVTNTLNQQEVSQMIEPSDIMVCMLCLMAVGSTLLVAYLAYKDEKEQKYLKYQLRQQLNLIEEFKIEIEKEKMMQKEIIRDFEGVIREAVDVENEKYITALECLQDNRMEHLCFARTKLAQYLGEPDEINYLSKQLSERLSNFQVNQKEKFELKDFLSLEDCQDK